MIYQGWQNQWSNVHYNPLSRCHIKCFTSLNKQRLNDRSEGSYQNVKGGQLSIHGYPYDFLTLATLIIAHICFTEISSVFIYFILLKLNILQWNHFFICSNWSRPRQVQIIKWFLDDSHYLKIMCTKSVIIHYFLPTPDYCLLNNVTTREYTASHDTCCGEANAYYTHNKYLIWIIFLWLCGISQRSPFITILKLIFDVN